MDKRKRLEVIAIPLLALVFVAALWNSLGRMGLFGTKAAPPAGAAPAAALARPAAANIPASTPAEMPKVKIPADRLVWGRDPFTLSELSPEGVSPIQDLQLMGITWSSDTSAYKAIINDEIVTVGSKLGAFTVVEISENIVKVQDKKGTYDLRIREEI